MSYKASGSIIVVGDTEQVSDKFKKRNLVLSIMDGNYEQQVQFEFVQDKVDLLDAVNVGDEVEVSFNLNGRSWTNPQGEVKYFNTNQGWRVETVSQNDGSMSKQNSATESDIPVATGEEDDDLPF